MSEVLAISDINVAVSATFSLIFASSWLFVTIAADDLTQKLYIFKSDVKVLHQHDQEELMERFYDIIRLYSNTKE